MGDSEARGTEVPTSACMGAILEVVLLPLVEPSDAAASYDLEILPAKGTSGELPLIF